MLLCFYFSSNLRKNFHLSMKNILNCLLFLSKNIAQLSKQNLLLMIFCCTKSRYTLSSHIRPGKPHIDHPCLTCIVGVSGRSPIIVILYDLEVMVFWKSRSILGAVDQAEELFSIGKTPVGFAGITVGIQACDVIQRFLPSFYSTGARSKSRGIGVSQPQKTGQKIHIRGAGTKDKPGIWPGKSFL